MGAVLLGGRSSRFGSDKAIAPAGQGMLGGVAVSALRGAGLDPVVGIGGSSGTALGLVTVPDLYPDEGPLGGLLTALRWARIGTVVMTTCDLPLLDIASVQAVVHAARNVDRRAVQPVVATVDGSPDVSLAAWPTEHLVVVARRFDEGQRAFQAALDETDWIGVEVRPDAVADVDSVEELRNLSR